MYFSFQTLLDFIGGQEGASEFFSIHEHTLWPIPLNDPDVTLRSIGISGPIVINVSWEDELEVNI